MGLFSNPRKNKAKWASIVMTGPGVQAGANISEEELDMATVIYISEHYRVFIESYNIVMTTKNVSTRKSRFKLARDHWGALVNVKPYCSKEGKKNIDHVTDLLIDMEDYVKHPNRAELAAKKAQKKAKSDAFWDTMAEMDMIDIFADDWGGKDN